MDYAIMVTPTEDYYSDHDGGKFTPIEPTTVATWKAPAFLENLAVDADGAVFVTVYSHTRSGRWIMSCPRRISVTLPETSTGRFMATRSRTSRDGWTNRPERCVAFQRQRRETMRRSI